MSRPTRRRWLSAWKLDRHPHVPGVPAESAILATFAVLTLLLGLITACSQGTVGAPTPSPTILVTAAATVSTQTASSPATSSPTLTPLLATATATSIPPPTPTRVLTPTSAPAPFKEVAALGVMIDNDPHARPQTGLNAAQVVYEMPAEFNLTRFLAIYFADPPQTVGSIRSTRPYYATAMTEYGGGLVHCLDVPGVTQVLDQGNVFNFDLCRGSGEEGAIRVSNRPAPFNLYVNAPLLQGELRQRPPRRAAALLPRATLPASAAGATGVSIVYPYDPAVYEHTVDWSWNGQTYERKQDGNVHHEADGSVVTTDVIVVQRAVTTATSYFGDAGYHVVNLIGSGDGIILAGGHSLAVHWKRTGVDQPTVFADAAGQAMALPPGRVFFEVVPTDAEVMTTLPG